MITDLKEFYLASKQKDQQGYKKLYYKNEDDTLLGMNRYIFLLDILHEISDIDGEIAECGVYKGGTALGMQEIIKGTNKKFYLFDTFKGVPKNIQSEQSDIYNKIHAFPDYNLPAIKSKFNDDDNLVFVEDDIFNTLKNKDYEIKYSFVHIDLNYYKSTLFALNFFFENLSKNGIIIIDDYGFEEYKDIIKKATDEFINAKQIEHLTPDTGQCIIIKK